MLKILTNYGTLISFEILHVLSLCNIVYFMSDCIISNPMGLGAPKSQGRNMITELINHVL